MRSPSWPAARGGGGSFLQDLPNRRRGVVKLPAGLVGDGGRIVRRGQTDGLDGIGDAACMGRHVGGRCRMAGRSGRSDRSRVAHIPSRRVRRDRKGTNRSDPHLAAGEGPGAFDRFTRPRVARRLRLEQR